MTKDSAKALMDSPVIKLVGLVITQTVTACVLYFGLRSEIRENKVSQEGRDNVQDVYRQQDAEKIKDLERRLEFFTSQPAMKPKGTIIKSEDVEPEG